VDEHEENSWAGSSTATDLSLRERPVFAQDDEASWLLPAEQQDRVLLGQRVGCGANAKWRRQIKQQRIVRNV
jgi:hypothetical protein